MLQKYYDKRKGLPPRPLLVEALQYVRQRHHALDIGSGSLNDSFFLLREGFQSVTAVDPAPQALRFSLDHQHENLRFVSGKIEEFDFSGSPFDLINAQFSLPFISDEQAFHGVWERIGQSLVSGGIFCGQLFGVNDEWNHDASRMVFHTRDQVDDLLTLFHKIKLLEKEGAGKTGLGQSKYWHVFHFIVQKL